MHELSSFALVLGVKEIQTVTHMHIHVQRHKHTKKKKKILSPLKTICHFVEGMNILHHDKLLLLVFTTANGNESSWGRSEKWHEEVE